MIWPSNQVRRSLAILCALTLANPPGYGWPQGQSAPADTQQQKLLPPEQLDSLVAPVALYPDPLLSQVLVAATYPLEIVEASRWLKQNSNLKGKDLANAATKQSWDASVQAMVAFPDVLTQLDTGISWTTDLGNAFLAQQAGVMEAVQRLRQKAKQSGKLESTQQQKVTTATENNTTYIEIQPANPQVIYVPQYNPTVVWGAPPAYYPYPPVVYPSAGAVVAASAISFGVGMAIGAMWSGGGGWGWNCGWGHNAVVVNNNFINNNHFNRVNVGNGNTWQHNSGHRQGVPYSNRNVANRYDGANANRTQRPTANQTQQRLGQENRQPGAGNAGQRQGQMGQANRQLGEGNAGQRQPGLDQRNQGGAQRSQGLNQPDNRNFGRDAGAGGDRVGNRQVSGGNFGGGGSGGRSAFGDMNQGGSRAKMNANRGSFSGGGGGSRGGSRGGGRRR